MADHYVNDAFLIMRHGGVHTLLSNSIAETEWARIWMMDIANSRPDAALRQDLADRGWSPQDVQALRDFRPTSVYSEDAPEPQAIGINGQRRTFNKVQLKEAQHITNGTAIRDEVEDVQRELKAEGYDIGKFGNHGIDGVAGKYTLAAMRKANVGPSSS